VCKALRLANGALSLEGVRKLGVLLHDDARFEERFVSYWQFDLRQL